LYFCILYFYILKMEKKRKRDEAAAACTQAHASVRAEVGQHALSHFSLRALLDCEDLRKSFCMRLRQHGWTIIELDDGASRGAEVVRQASEAAERFFLQATQEQKEAARLLFSEGPCSTGKGLVGYNNPTPAKEVYRLRRGSAQPWPAFGTRRVFMCGVCSGE
jgi:hypothetical protein